jgi:hypothetical protein
MLPEYMTKPWRWQGEDYRGGWGWQMLVIDETGEGLLVGQGPASEHHPHGGPYENLRAHVPVAAELCVTGMLAAGKPRAPCVHVLHPVAKAINEIPNMILLLQAVAASKSLPEAPLAQAILDKIEGAV